MQAGFPNTYTDSDANPETLAEAFPNAETSSDAHTARVEIFGELDLHDPSGLTLHRNRGSGGGRQPGTYRLQVVLSAHSLDRISSERPKPTEYLSEQPEMSSQDERSLKAETMKGH